MSQLKILLLNPMPIGSFSPPFPVLPIGLASIASIAQNENADVKVLTGMNLVEQLQNILQTWHPDLTGFQTFINNISLCNEMASIIKTRYPDSFIVYGGVQASNDPDTVLLKSFVDAVIPGEGELHFRQLLSRLKTNPFETPGLIYRKTADSTTKNPGSALYESLDDLPEIPYNLFYGKGSVPVGHLLTHRGCPFHCSHCPLQFRAGVTIRAHSVNRIIETIKMLSEQYGIQHIEFYDENFTMDHDHVKGICKGIHNLPVSFSCTARISQIDIDLCKIMADAGCSSIIFGLGSGVERLQDILGTHENLLHTKKLISDLADTTIQPIVVFSMGIPSETRKEFKETVKYALSLQNCKIRFEPAAPLPGSQLFKTAQAGGRFLVKEWNDYTRPGQLVYLPAGRRKIEFMFNLYKAKVMARIKLRRDSGAFSKKEK